MAKRNVNRRGMDRGFEDPMAQDMAHYQIANNEIQRNNNRVIDRRDNSFNGPVIEYMRQTGRRPRQPGE